jgi:thiaminase/transcriptional activator TenA
LERAADSRGFAEVLAVLLPVEWCYLAWARRVSAGLRRRQKTLPRARHLRDWIALHDNPDFAAFVGWMRREMDRRGPALPPARRQAVERRFVRTMALESAFFDAFHAPRLDARAAKV